VEEDGARDQGEEVELEPRERRAEGGGRGEVSRLGDRRWSQSAGGIGCGGGAEAPGEKEPRRGHGGPGGGGGDGDTRGGGQSAAVRAEIWLWPRGPYAKWPMGLSGWWVLPPCQEPSARTASQNTHGPEPNPGETLARPVVPLRRGAVRCGIPDE